VYVYFKDCAVRVNEWVLWYDAQIVVEQRNSRSLYWVQGSSWIWYNYKRVHWSPDLCLYHARLWMPAD
jgi:hypothetical protein